MDLHPADSG